MVDPEVQMSRLVTEHATDVFLADDCRTLLRVASTWRSLQGSSEACREFFRQGNDPRERYAPIDLAGMPISARHFFSSRNLPVGVVFCGVSIWLRGYAQTIYVPVPFGLDDRMRDFPDAVTVGKTSAEVVRGNPEWGTFALQFSHALTNVSFSVRTFDRPHLGWVAYAHERAHAVYISDVRSVTSHQVTSAARDVEPYLAMSSVLYLPILIREDPAGDYAEVVLWLWSPQPGRWDHLRTAPLADARGAVQLCEWRRACESLEKDFSWLADTVLKEEKAQVFVESQFFTLFQRLYDWLHSGSREDLELADRFFHRVPRLIEAAFADHPRDAGRVRDFLLDAIFGDDRAMGIWVRAGLPFDQTTARWDLPGDNRGEAGTIEELERAIRQLSPSWKLQRISEGAAVPLVVEAARNAERRAERLTEIAVVGSRRYVTIDFEQIPTQIARNALTGTADAFRRYYAIRRGLMVPRADEHSTGIGLALQGMLGAHRGIYQKLFLSPDGNRAVSRVSVPVLDQGEDLT